MTMMVRWQSSAMRPSAMFALAVVSLGALSFCNALASSDTSSCGIIPLSLPVPEGLATTDAWQQSSMVPLELSLGQVKTQEEISVSSMLQQHTKSAGSVAFVVRRPG